MEQNGSTVAEHGASNLPHSPVLPLRSFLMAYLMVDLCGVNLTILSSLQAEGAEQGWVRTAPDYKG